MKKVMQSVLALVCCLLLGVNIGFADVGQQMADQAKQAASANTDQLMQIIKGLQDKISGMEKELGTLRSQVKNAGKVTIPDSVTKEINGLKAEVKNLKNRKIELPKIAQASNVPSWIEGTKFGGSLILRYQYESYNKLPDRSRLCLKLRYGVSKQVTDELLVKFMLATGSQNLQNDWYVAGSSAVSTFNKANVWVEQMYVEYKPEAVEGLTLWLGKFAPNWKRRFILFDNDILGVEGVAESYKREVADGLVWDLNMAQLIATEGAGEDADSQIYVFDTGLTQSFEDSIITSMGLRGTFYLYDGYTEVNGLANVGNARVAMVSGDIGLDVAEQPLNLWWMVGKNLNDNAAVPAQGEGQDFIYGFGFNYRNLEEPGDWCLGYSFQYNEANTFPAVFADGDSGVGQHAHKFKVGYRLFEPTDINFYVVVPRELTGDKDYGYVSAYVDLVTRF